MSRDRCISDPLRQLASPRPSVLQRSDRAPTATPVPPPWAHPSLVRENNRRAAPRRHPSRAATRRYAAAQDATSPTAPHIAPIVPTSTVTRPGAPTVHTEHQERSRGPPTQRASQPVRPGRLTRQRRRAPGATGALREMFSTRPRSIRNLKNRGGPNGASWALQSVSQDPARNQRALLGPSQRCGSRGRLAPRPSASALPAASYATGTASPAPPR